MKPPTLLAVPNVSDGREEATIAAIADAFAGAGEAPPAPAPVGAGTGAPAGATRLLDVHCDGDHDRSVFTLAGPVDGLADALLAGARVAVERIDVIARAGADRGGGSSQAGQHPHVGAIDVVP